MYAGIKSLGEKIQAIFYSMDCSYRRADWEKCIFCEPIYLSCSDQPQEVYEELPEHNQKEELDIYEEMQNGSQLEEPHENLPCSNQPEELYEDLPCSNQQEDYHEAFNEPDELYEDLVSLLLQYPNSQLSVHILVLSNFVHVCFSLQLPPGTVHSTL